MAASQAGKSRLEGLPNELLIMTFETLASESLDLKDIPAYRVHQNILRNLCLVSKTMEAIARPELYQDIRLYNHMAVVRLCAAFCSDPTLASSVQSILFWPPGDSWRRDIRNIDLRPLRPFQDPDYAFWTRGRSKAKIRMPQKTREELVCNLFSKALSKIPGLKSMYFKLPELLPISPESLERLSGDAEFLQQLSMQARLFQDFCQGRSLPNLSKLRTVGLLENQPRYSAQGLCKNLFRSPALQQVFCASLSSEGHSGAWHSELENLYGPRAGVEESSTEACTSVKRIVLRRTYVRSEEINALAAAFPSLESLTINGCHVFMPSMNSSPMDNHELSQLLGRLKNFHTLELDSPRERFAAAIETDSGTSQIIMLSAMSKLRTLLVPVDFAVGFTSDDKPPRIHRINTVLPNSLRHLILLLDHQCKERLSWEGRIRKSRVSLVVEPFLREVAPALLMEFPHLKKVDLCYDMEDYSQNKVHPLIARSTADSHVAS